VAEGEIHKAQSLILRLGAKRLGPAPGAAQVALRSIADRLFDATSWDTSSGDEL
jgi:hypothetical protein